MLSGPYNRNPETALGGADKNFAADAALGATIEAYPRKLGLALLVLSSA
jgi:hypothetical protein